MAYDFSEALTLMKTGAQVFRIGWAGKPNFVEMSGPIGTPICAGQRPLSGVGISVSSIRGISRFKAVCALH